MSSADLGSSGSFVLGVTLASVVVIELQSTANNSEENRIVATEMDLSSRLKIDYDGQVRIALRVWRKSLQYMKGNFYSFEVSSTTFYSAANAGKHAEIFSSFRT